MTDIVNPDSAGTTSHVPHSGGGAVDNVPEPDEAAEATVPVELREFRSLRSDVWRQFRRHKGALAG
ncbi:MAG: hypothetical protein WKF60_09825, partial [Ilumatobacter sp.]